MGKRTQARKPSQQELEALVLGSPELREALGALVGRLRQCPLEGCGKWFLPRKRQTYCTRDHANRANYLLWVKRGRPRGSKGGEAHWKGVRAKRRKRKETR
jgi:predicted RNA-binding Zn ribbon-like protein